MEHRARPISDKAIVFRFPDSLMPSPVATYANPAIGNQRMCPKGEDVPPNNNAEDVSTVTAMLALPLASKVTEFELSEHVGAASCAGCTVQASDTAWLNALSKLRLTVEVAL